MKVGILDKYASFLPIFGSTPPLSLGEGDTPLIRCSRLEKEVGCRELYFKLEGSIVPMLPMQGLNPSLLSLAVRFPLENWPKLLPTGLG
jgi:hypothetical protein